MNYVIYTGVIFMPDKNAAAHRAQAFANMIKECGYIPVILGMSKSIEVTDIMNTKQEKDGCIYFYSSYPKNTRTWLNMMFDIKNFKKIILSLGKENIKAIIAMDYFSLALIRLIKLCKKLDIKFVSDTVDWFAKSNYSFPKSLIKDFDTELRMKYINKHIKNMIVISNYLYEYYKKYVPNLIVIPGVVKSYENMVVNVNKNKDRNIIKFLFAGAPGNKCEKEKIDWVIKAICEINEEKKGKYCQFIIAGIEEDTLKRNRPDLVKLKGFKDSIKCLGWLSHKSSIELIKESDFTVIVREDNLLSKAGFPTKLGESFSYGIPVFVTPTSNIKDYIREGYGFVTNDCSYESVRKTMNEIVNLSRKEIEHMHEAVLSYNPLDYKYYVKKMKEVLEK